MADEITPTNIVDAALAPARVKTDAGEVQSRSIDELIAAKREGEASAITGSAWGCLRPARTVLPAAIGPRNTEQT